MNKPYYKIYNKQKKLFAKKGSVTSVKNNGYFHHRSGKKKLLDNMFSKEGDLWVQLSACKEQLIYLKEHNPYYNYCIIKYELVPTLEYLLIDNELIPNNEVGELIYE